MIQRVVLYATLGTLCGALGYEWSSTEFLCILALTWAADLLGRQSGYEAAELECQRILKQAQDLVDQAQQIDRARRGEQQ